MKAFISAMGLLVMVVCAGAQTFVWFRNSSNTLVTYCGNTLVPVGNRFSVNLYYSPDTPEAPPESTFIALGNPVGFFSPGHFDGGVRTTPSTTQPTERAWFQVRGWETVYGSTYEEAVNNPNALSGVSIRFAMFGGYGTTPTFPIYVGGFTGLDIGSSEQCIPEPGTMALILFGFGLLGCCWRRKAGCTKSSTGPREPDIC